MLLRALFLATTVALSACSDTCSNTIISQSDSPTGEHTAVMFQRDCGATTGYSTQISILPRGESPLGSGNAFRADDDHGKAAASDWGGPWAELKWLAPDHLQIKYAVKSRLFENDENVSGIKITYQAVNR